MSKGQRERDIDTVLDYRLLLIGLTRDTQGELP